MGRLSKDPPSPRWAGIIQSVEELYRTKRWRKGEFALCLGLDIYLLSSSDMDALGSQAPGLRLALNSIGSQFSGLQVWYRTISPAFLVLQFGPPQSTVDGGTSQLP